MVYRGGLENRFGRKLNGGSNPSLSASFAECRLAGDEVEKNKRRELRSAGRKDCDIT